MARTLFVGDSHSYGYRTSNTKYAKGEALFWQDNNFAEIYAELNEKPVAIYAMPGASNQHYVSWVKTFLDYYDDVDELFVQFTYWTRYMLATNTSAQPFVNSWKSNAFAFGPNNLPPEYENKPNVDRWQDDYDPVGKQKEYIVHFEPRQHVNYEEQAWPGKEVTKPFFYTHLWHNTLTHIKYRQVCADFFIIDRLCEQRGINWHLFRMNDRIFVPDNPNYFGELTNCKSYNIMAVQDWFKETKGIDIETKEYRYDEEHYNYDIHLNIAKEYIPYLQDANKSDTPL